MKFLLSMALASACFTSYVSADPSKAFSIANEAILSITNRTNNLTNAIEAWDGTNLLEALNNIHIPSVETSEYVANATTLIQQNAATWDNTQSFKIGTPAQRLAYAVNATIANLIRKKSDFVKMSAASIVIQDLSTFLNVSDKFATALTSLIPTELQEIGTILVSQNLDSLKQGIACFNGTDSECYTAIVNPNRTYELAVRYNAMTPDGSPYA